MSAYERDFASYELTDNVHQLAGALLPEMASVMDYHFGDAPTEEALQGFVGHIGPAKWLQDNIDLGRDRLGSNGDAVTIAADWVERSGVMKPAYRSFVSAEIHAPLEVDTAVIGSGVARWMLRRTAQLQALRDVSGLRTGKVLVAGGTREMKESEHPRVASLAQAIGKLPTEAQFARLAIVPHLLEEGFDADAVTPDTGVGDEVMKAVAQEAVNGSVLVIGNAPSGIQSAGQFRLAARQFDQGFDANGSQLFIASDALPVARHGEGPATHQNPFTALGQIARDALYLYRNAE